MDRAGIAALACPSCRGALEYRGTTARGRVVRGSLDCAGCRATWEVREGLCRLYREEAVRGSDRFMRFLYDRLARLHDPAVRYTLPWFQSGTEAELRAGYIRRMELDRLRAPEDGRPLRILDVGFGTGADLQQIRAAIPRGLEVEVWGVDLSLSMLKLGLRRLREEGPPRLRIVMADAHALPFPDASFDRVFHVGGIAGYRAPARALAEMARVARPGTPIVVVDEQLDPSTPQSLYNRLTFRLVTFYDPDPHCPIEHVPASAREVRAEQLCRFFYCLSFRSAG